MCYCFIVFCCLISVIFWRNSTSNWPRISKHWIQISICNACLLLNTQQQQHLHQPQQLNWHKRNCFAERLSYATVPALCVWVEWEHAKFQFVCAKTELYRSNRTNEWLLFWQPTADHCFKMWQNKCIINLNGESTADWTRCYFSPIMHFCFCFEMFLFLQQKNSNLHRISCWCFCHHEPETMLHFTTQSQAHRLVCRHRELYESEL